MSKDIHVIKEVLSGHVQGLSLDAIRTLTGVPKTSVKRTIDRAHATGRSIEAILQLTDEEIESLKSPRKRPIGSDGNFRVSATIGDHHLSGVTDENAGIPN